MSPLGSQPTLTQGGTSTQFAPHGEREIQMRAAILADDNAPAQRVESGRQLTLPSAWERTCGTGINSAVVGAGELNGPALPPGFTAEAQDVRGNEGSESKKGNEGKKRSKRAHKSQRGAKGQLLFSNRSSTNNKTSRRFADDDISHPKKAKGDVDRPRSSRRGRSRERQSRNRRRSRSRSRSRSRTKTDRRTRSRSRSRSRSRPKKDRRTRSRSESREPRSKVPRKKGQHTAGKSSYGDGDELVDGTNAVQDVDNHHASVYKKKHASSPKEEGCGPNRRTRWDKHEREGKGKGHKAKVATAATSGQANLAPEPLASTAVEGTGAECKFRLRLHGDQFVDYESLEGAHNDFGVMVRRTDLHLYSKMQRAEALLRAGFKDEYEGTIDAIVSALHQSEGVSILDDMGSSIRAMRLRVAQMNGVIATCEATRQEKLRAPPASAASQALIEVQHQREEDHVGQMMDDAVSSMSDRQHIHCISCNVRWNCSLCVRYEGSSCHTAAHPTWAAHASARTAVYVRVQRIPRVLHCTCVR